MQRIQFSPRAVAFLDILGFKELVREAHASTAGLNRLSRLMRKIESNKPLNRSLKVGVATYLRPQSIEISDSIVLSTPLMHPDHPEYWGLAIIIMRCSQIASILLEEGYLLSGAINIGSIQHTQKNVVGSAYQDAYSLQSTISSPAIVLCPAAADAWQASDYRIGQSPMCMRRAVTFRQRDAAGRPTEQDREVEIVNVFEPEYMNSIRVIGRRGPPPTMDDAWLAKRINEVEATISKNLALFAVGTPGHNRSVLAKWEWMAQLFREEGRASIETGFSMHPDLVVAP